MARQHFVEFVSDAILALPQDLKSMLRILDDQEIDEEARVTLAGAILHVLSASNSIPGVRGILQNVGDILLLRLVLERIAKKSPEGFKRHVQDSPEFLEPLEVELGIARAFLGDRIKVLEKVADSVTKQTFEGKTARECITDTESGNWIHGAVIEAITEQFDFEESDVDRELKKVDRILPALESRLT